jgi:hypothetical protein
LSKRLLTIRRSVPSDQARPAQYSQQRSYRKALPIDRAALATREDSVLLIGGLDDDVLGQHTTGRIADQPVALIQAVGSGATVARQGSPTAIGDDPAALALMADHRDEHRYGYVLDAADTDARHHQVLKHVHTDAYLGDAAQVASERSRRRRADGHDGHFMTCCAQALCRAHCTGTFALGKTGECLGATTAV